MRFRRWLLLLCALPGVRADLAAQTPPRLTLTETLRLDANAEDFPGINSALIGPRGMIAIPLMADNQLRLYDSAGKRVAAVGRKGAGPGEFERMLRSGWVGDTLWIYDSSHRRFTLITAAGRLVRTIPLVASLNAAMQPGEKDYSNGVYMFVPNSYQSDGASLGAAMLMKGRSAQGTIDTDSWVIRATPSGAYAKMAPQPSNEAYAVDVSRAGSSWGWAVPFVFQAQAMYAPDGSRFGFLTVHPDAKGNGVYKAVVITAKGDTMFARSYPYTGEPIPARTLDSALNVAQTRSANTPPDVVAELTSKMRGKLPVTFAPVTSMMFGRDNTAWITKRRTPEGVTVLVLNAKGDPMATLTMPPRSRLLDASLSEILVSETDDDGLSSVVRYRVSGRTCGPPECR